MWHLWEKSNNDMIVIEVIDSPRKELILLTLNTGPFETFSLMKNSAQTYITKADEATYTLSTQRTA